MFEPSEHPRVFALPPGVHFADGLISGLRARWPQEDPLAPARTHVHVNTRRAARTLRDRFDAGEPGLLPQIRTLDEFDTDLTGLPTPRSALGQRLEIARLVQTLIDSAPDIAPTSAVFDLADSLIALFDEAVGEGVDPEKILALDVSDQSGHWARAQQFLGVAQQFFDSGASGKDALLRLRTLRLIDRWQHTPPTHPVIVAGSTGSRGTTHLLMQAVARLPQGAVVLPGFDFHMPDRAWASLAGEGVGEDHPQYRALTLMQSLNLSPKDIPPWNEVPPPSDARNRLISLALRPAPVTDQWRKEQQTLADLGDACAELTLIEAQSRRDEAGAIAFGMREGIEQGKTTMLVTPDRQLARQVSAFLQRWGIRPDDSAGLPLHLSAPGRLLRQVAALFGPPPDAATFFALLKHPLVATGSLDRGAHLLHTRNFELWVRANGVAFPDSDALTRWAEKESAADAASWSRWVAGFLTVSNGPNRRPLTEFVQLLQDLTEKICAGADGVGSGALWEKNAGQAARAVVDALHAQAEKAGKVDLQAFKSLLHSLLQAGALNEPLLSDPRAMIRGTLEARTQTADLVILGGLNEGIWPGQPAPDPWLNRQMRRALGMLLPERRIGLSAHDFQQACGAKTVWLTRSIRDDSAETVPSRWVNRLTNLLSGLHTLGGPEALAAARARGAHWLAVQNAWDNGLEQATPEPRVAPAPPRAQRPNSLPVTAIATLSRDPFAVYARYVLRLRALRPLHQTPDAALRGTIIHRLFHQFIEAGNIEKNAFFAELDTVFARDIPWASTRKIWRASLARIVDGFLADEQYRQILGTPQLFETRGSATLPKSAFTVTCFADRIDITPARHARIYDYKTGKPPSAKKQGALDIQLLLEAAMAEMGAFKDLGRTKVDAAEYIGLGAQPSIVAAPIETFPTNAMWASLEELIDCWNDPARGYVARYAIEQIKFESDYDHLARFGEWDDAATPVTEVVS